MNYRRVFTPRIGVTQQVILIVPLMTTPGLGSAIPTVDVSANVLVLSADSAFVTTPVGPVHSKDGDERHDVGFAVPTSTASINVGLIRHLS